jgi:hypothetical protein
MMIEVPKDKYAEALNEFRNKILEGKVPGVTNPDDASKYVKQGRLTYQQALNLCKPGTIESLTYDAATGVINCSFAFGISFLVTFIFCYAQKGDRKEAMYSAFLMMDAIINACRCQKKYALVWRSLRLFNGCRGVIILSSLITARVYAPLGT